MRRLKACQPRSLRALLRVLNSCSCWQLEKRVTETSAFLVLHQLISITHSTAAYGLLMTFVISLLLHCVAKVLISNKCNKKLNRMTG